MTRSGTSVELNETGSTEWTIRLRSSPVQQGYEDTKVDDSMGSGTTVNIERLFR